MNPGGMWMEKSSCVFLILFLLLLNIYGCVPLIVGGAVGAVGGYAISKDTIQGDTDKPYAEIWDSALRVAQIRGTIMQQDSQKGYIELNAESSRVSIRLIRMTRATTRVKISARKFSLPNLDLAQDLFVKIIAEAD